MYIHDNRIVITLDAGGTNLVFGAMRGCEYITEPVTYPSNAHDLDLCLDTMVKGFREVIDSLDEKPVAISFAFPGPADYPNGIIGGYRLSITTVTFLPMARLCVVRFRMLTNVWPRPAVRADIKTWSAILSAPALASVW